MNYCPECKWNMEEPELYCNGSNISGYHIQWYQKGSRPYKFSGYIRIYCSFCGYDELVKD